MNSVRSNISLKYQRFATSGSKDRGIRVCGKYLRQFWRCKNVRPHFENLKIVFDIYSLSLNTAIIVFMKKYRMDRRLNKSRHWICMFNGTPCMYNVIVKIYAVTFHKVVSSISLKYYYLFLLIQGVPINMGILWDQM